VRATVPFGEAFVALCRERGLSQRQAALQMHLDPAYVSRVVNGRQRTNGRLLRHVERLFGLPHDYFIETRRRALSEAVPPHLVDALYDEYVKGD
jgi:transcriptional regulator with XRE-family HTH domain